MHGQRDSELELSSLAEEHADGSSSSQSPPSLDEDSSSESLDSACEELLNAVEELDSAHPGSEVVFKRLHEGC